jgi:hypothetical protein
MPALAQRFANVPDALDECVLAHGRTGPDGFEQLLFR